MLFFLSCTFDRTFRPARSGSRQGIRLVASQVTRSKLLTCSDTCLLTLCLAGVVLLAGCDSSPPLSDAKNEEQVAEALADEEASGDEDARVELSLEADDKPESMDSSDNKPAATPALYSVEAFHKACAEGKLRVVEICLGDALDVNEPDPKGYTPLAFASHQGQTEVVKLLLKKGAKVDSRDFEDKTPLIHASSGPFPKTVQVLLDAGADIEAVDNGEHFTPLMTAAALGNVKVLEVLLAAGANKSSMDLDGETALDFAKESNFPARDRIIELLSAE